MPRSCMRAVTPYGAIISSVGGWYEPARRSWVNAGSASHTTTGTPRVARPSAHINPVGPAPAMTTGSASLGTDVVLADDLPPPPVIALHALLQLLGTGEGGVQALFAEHLAHVREGENRPQLRIEFGDDRIGRPFRGEERVPHVHVRALHAELDQSGDAFRGGMAFGATHRERLELLRLHMGH